MSATRAPPEPLPTARRSGLPRGGNDPGSQVDWPGRMRGGATTTGGSNEPLGCGARGRGLGSAALSLA